MPLVPPFIETLAPYVPGRPIEEVQRQFGLDSICKLASNESPLGPSPLALEAIRSALSDIHHYPDAGCLALREKLAQRFRVKIDNVIVGAGSEGIIGTIMRTFLCDDDEIITADGSFIGFAVMARGSGKKIHWVPMRSHRYDLDAMAARITDHTKIIYLANPDNPMGTYFTVEEFEGFMARVPERTLVLLDEAYFEFACERSDYPDSMRYRLDNVITLRTFSKAYGLAGVRIGYGFAHNRFITNLMKVKLPFEPSALALAAGLAALDDKAHLKATVDVSRKGRDYLAEKLYGLGIATVPSATNFIATLWPSAEEATHIAEGALQRGVILRPLGPFGWPHAIRISAGLPAENEKCIGVLATLLQTDPDQNRRRK